MSVINQSCLEFKLSNQSSSYMINHHLHYNKNNKNLMQLSGLSQGQRNHRTESCILVTFLTAIEKLIENKTELVLMLKPELFYLVKEFIVLFLLVQINLIDTFNVDPDHQAMAPECGQTHPRMKRSTSTRISNAEQSQYHYPWIISVLRFDESPPLATRKSPSLCGGSIITET